jgi:Flp pilus assembly protein TadD
MAAVSEVFSLAWQHHQSGNYARAEELYRQIVQADPDHADGWCFLGAACQAQGKLAEAETSYRRAIQMMPGHPSAQNCLGILLAKRGQLDEASVCFQRALEICPGDPDSHNNLGIILDMQGKRDKAIAHYQQALRGRPGNAEAHTNLGVVLTQRGRLDEAVACFHKALQINPRCPEAHNNLGIALRRQGRLEEAVSHCREALRINPQSPEAHNSLATALMRQANYDESLNHYEEAVRLKPQFADARWNRALLKLTLGHFEQGWPEYEWRWTQPGYSRRQFQQPLWDASDAARLTVLLHAEQGLGDTVHFIRYAPLVKKRSGTVIVECQPRLAALCRAVPGIDLVVAQGSPLPQFELQAPLLSLPALFHTTLATIPANVPYIHPDAALVGKWRQELQKPGGRERSGAPSTVHCPRSTLRVGIGWQGSAKYAYDNVRSIPLKHFERLSKVDGVQLVSLQKGPGAEQLRALSKFSVHELGPVDDATGAFMDTAAIIQSLDLVICSDTGLPHLAGAVGVPVWLALALVPDWRWLLERVDCPWYPTMRLFRQGPTGQWDEVFERIAGELDKLICCGRQTIH